MQNAIVSSPLAIPVIRSNVLGTAATCLVNIVSGKAAPRWTSQTPANVIASNIECILAEMLASDGRCIHHGRITAASSVQGRGRALDCAIGPGPGREFKQNQIICDLRALTLPPGTGDRSHSPRSGGANSVEGGGETPDATSSKYPWPHCS